MILDHAHIGLLQNAPMLRREVPHMLRRIAGKLQHSEDVLRRELRLPLGRDTADVVALEDEGDGGGL
jgi:hypothetical protein